MEIVLDSWALIAYFLGQRGQDVVRDLFKEAARTERNLLLSVVNWGEVLYAIERRQGEEKKEEVARIMSHMHLDIIDADQEMANQAATYKVSGKISYADCFAAALAKLRKATLVTGDKEFK